MPENYGAAGQEMVPPGQAVDTVDPMKAKCITFYAKSHENHLPTYAREKSKVAGKLKSLEANRNDTNEIQMAFAIGVLIELQKRIEVLENYDDKQFGMWYDDDSQNFKNIDLNSDGSVDEAEFVTWMKRAYSLSDEEAKEAFKTWDFDKDKGKLGKEEYCTLMAVFHTENELNTLLVETEAAESMLGDMFPCGFCCFGYSCYFGAMCCCCTLGLSMLPFYCQLKMMAEKTEYNKAHEAEIAEAMAKEKAQKVLSKTQQMIKNGPADTLKAVTLKALGQE